jgi:hypothetical protein
MGRKSGLSPKYVVCNQNSSVMFDCMIIFFFRRFTPFVHCKLCHDKIQMLLQLNGFLSCCLLVSSLFVCLFLI